MSEPDLSLRSHRWFQVPGLRTFGHRSRAKQMGYDDIDLDGRPVIALINTWSDINPCHAHFKDRVTDLKRGVLEAGGLPLEIPAIALAENFQKPTTMLYRNLLALETEELLRSYPIDGAVLMGGCDKTTPGLLMGALSIDLPSIFFPAGPMLKGCWRGNVLGSGSDSWKYWDELRAGGIDECEWSQIEAGIARSVGHCMTMGTASTMTAVAEAMGMTLPGASSIPAALSHHNRMAVATGRRIVSLVEEGLRIREIVGAEAIHNATVAALSLGGSTNAAIHLVALARRAGVEFGLDDIGRLADTVPVLSNIRPAGTYLMEDYFDAGGLPAQLRLLGNHLELEARTVSGGSLGEDIAAAEVVAPDIIRDPGNPVDKGPALAVLRGNLCPDGALIKPTTVSRRLRRHSGPALVFDGYEDMKARIDDPGLDVDEDTVLVLRGVGPIGGPGMPEWGMIPIPQRLVEQGVRDMVRISDARMSGTSYGACVLHVAPESAVGGPLSKLRTGDLVSLDIDARTLAAEVDAEEWALRESIEAPRRRGEERGYLRLFLDHVEQADKGCDFDFLQGVNATEPAIC
ncbi:dihydroxy-acid dehydratase [Brevibacterium sanguinis]|uniref:Dihydroxy-acid dehydratase n=2 Tax=Brevibacterium TaxID=1696 RepID=A0A366IH81_9MICO|nr:MULTISPECIES: dihydroxy-acid dehydratase [Brevibacterium]RBP64949.1 dihydroxy-acid dehydratase [Brevibacterium sanguinis]RBP71212.1 dihydroxy-acid dehydratase [Brevibacterium celere]